MQSNEFQHVLQLLSSQKIVFWIKIAVFAGILLYIGYVLRRQPFDLSVVRNQWRQVSRPGWWVAGLLLLTPINWGLEALKWQLLVRRVEPISFRAAYQGVLAGLSLGFVLPAQLGDTAGRVLSLRTGERGAAIGASLVSGGMQFYVALVFGTLAWGYHLQTVPERNTPAGRWLLALLSILSLGGILFGLTYRRLIRWSVQWPRLNRWSTYWSVIGRYSNGDIGLALGAAALRYLVFSLQFYVAMRLLGVILPGAAAAAGIGLVFLAKTITPAFNLLSDLGVREAASLWVFAPTGTPASLLLTITLTLWLANVLLPVVVGLLYVWRLKLATS